MNKKRIVIIVAVLIILIVAGLWIGGIIPKCIAKIVATNYLKNNFPKKQFEYTGIEWSSAFDGYSIRFKDEKGNYIEKYPHKNVRSRHIKKIIFK